MRKLWNSLYVLLFMAVSLQLASCIDNDNDYPEPLTEEQYSQYLSMMQGGYSGKMFFWNDTISKNDKTDSIANVYAYVKGRGDSTITVSIHPKYLVKTLTKSNKELTEAVSDMNENIILESKFYLSQLQDGYMYFGVYTGKKSLTVNVDGAEHELDFTFYNYVNNNGWYRGGAMRCDMFLTKIELDGNTIKEFNVNYSYDDRYSAQYILTLKK